ncbi:unnamed protein product [Parnassius apollo]|uniref:(apollo) hypothetical protein n=1 Tax=Parnassius apollo TaxID=110799 RepID=A0A8S3W4P3_PARAO|nr:unnamed protein product [Parnassius apollo]
MKQWQPALCFVVMQMMLANSIITTTSIPKPQKFGQILKPSLLSPALNWNGRTKSSAKENSTKDMGEQTGSSETTSTPRTMLIPVYDRLQSTKRIIQPYKTQFYLETIDMSPKKPEPITKLSTKANGIAADALLSAELDLTKVTSSKITSLKTLQTQTRTSVMCVNYGHYDQKESFHFDGFHPSMHHPSMHHPPSFQDSYSEMPEMMHPIQHAALPRGLKAYPLPLEGSDHELQLNVTWLPNIGPPVSDYSLEVRSVTDTVDCMTPLCYEYNIPGNSLWWVVPPYPSPVAESCAVRPGCEYVVRLIAHPWDGHTSANLNVQLDECVAGVCSCAHAPRLPTPRVAARAVSVHGELFVNVTWDLPPPPFPYRLPSGLKKQYFFVSLGKQMVSDAHPSPWFAHSTSRRVDIDTPVTVPEEPRWILLPTVERSGERGGGRSAGRQQSIMLDVKLLARVNLIDERGCVGPAGNATAYDPTEAKKITYTSYAIWAILGGVFVLAMITLLAVSARIVKRVLNIFRPAPAAASLEPLRNNPIWFPLSR